MFLVQDNCKTLNYGQESNNNIPPSTWTYLSVKAAHADSTDFRILSGAEVIIDCEEECLGDLYKHRILESLLIAFFVACVTYLSLLCCRWIFLRIIMNQALDCALLLGAACSIYFCHVVTSEKNVSAVSCRCRNARHMT